MASVFGNNPAASLGLDPYQEHKTGEIAPHSGETHWRPNKQGQTTLAGQDNCATSGEMDLSDTCIWGNEGLQDHVTDPFNFVRF
ncbi:hypothetical protein B5807_09435 [Epicoccum nigrum]|uniref:Uncharacterized protein n=1 Tax=Epicoccum nigrum TaxID=105696 RepID=A0A1Y2LP68_EPING|nr:hypothetical protein B5807_09435 [Epicoccum nigrum]